MVFDEIASVDPQNLFPAGSVWQFHLNVHLEAPWTEDGVIKEVLSVGHADDYDVVQGLHSVNVGEKLIHHLVTDLPAYSSVYSPLLADGIDLVEDDYVERTAIAQLLLICPRLSEQLPNVLL